MLFLVSDKVKKSESEWKAKLTLEQYKVLREKGTEPPFTGAYVHTNEKGMFTCAACGNELFSSNTKFDSGTGWPSFWAPEKEKNVELITDTSHGTIRTEVRCARCGSHLGHVFDDGPPATGQRFCINSCALYLKKSKEK